MYVNNKLLFFFILVINIIIRDGVFSWVVDDEGCPLNDGGSGDCIPLRFCESVLSYINEFARNKYEQSEVISNFVCGFTPYANGRQIKVCCPREIMSHTEETQTDIIKSKSNFGDDNIKLLPLNNCGKMANDDRIVHGVYAGLMEFPWMALIKYNTKDSWKYKCGGTLINNRYVLTAAHCIRTSASNRPSEIILGEYDISTVRDCEETNELIPECAPPTEVYGIEKIIAHKGFNTEIKNNDIALIRLNETVDLTKAHIYPICLPVNDQLKKLKTKNSIVAGWGRTEYEQPSPRLMKLELPIVQFTECQKLFGNVNLSENQMCAGGIEEKGTYRGDSGGPLMTVDVINRKPKFIQHGIISFGSTNYLSNQPTVFTKVSKYMDWILENIEP